MSGSILIKALCAILLLVAAPATATAQADAQGNDQGGDGVTLPGWARVQLQFTNGDRLTPDALVIDVSPDGTTDMTMRLSISYYLDLEDAAEVRDENKLDLGGVLGGLGLGQETTSSEFEGAVRIGDMFVIGNVLMLDPLPGIDGRALATSIRTTVIANQGESFVIGGLYLSVEEQGDQVPWLSDIPLLGQMFRSRVGDAHRKGNKLLILVTPHLIDLD